MARVGGRARNVRSIYNILLSIPFQRWDTRTKKFREVATSLFALIGKEHCMYCNNRFVLSGSMVMKKTALLICL